MRLIDGSRQYDDLASARASANNTGRRASEITMPVWRTT